MQDDATDSNAGSGDEAPQSSALVTDILGLGALAKSAASKEIAKSISKVTGLFVDPARALLMGFAKTKVDSNRIVSIAKAQAEARQIQVSADQLVERMQERVIASEIRRQINIETATTDAIGMAESSTGKEDPRPIEDDWISSWIDGVSEVSDADVRRLWSKLLAAESIATSNRVKKASLPLLQLLDADLARSLSEYIKFRVHYGAYPVQKGINPEIITTKQLSMLSEIGFLSRDTETFFEFDEFRLHLGGGGRLLGAMMHSTLGLTHRGHEICTAVFDGSAIENEQPDHSTMLRRYKQIVGGAVSVGPVPISLEFVGGGSQAVFVTLNKADKVHAALDINAITAQFKASNISPSDLSRELLSSLADERQITGVDVREPAANS